jgi:F-type H+-transporting ATPase subunit b
VGFLSLDGTFWVQLINFAIFFVILNVVFLKPVGRAISKRRAYIDGLTTDYERYVQQVRQLQDEADSQRAAARRDAEATLSSARAATSNETAEIAAGYAAQAHETIEAAHQTVTAEVEAARASQAPVIGALADLMLERVLLKELT